MVNLFNQDALWGKLHFVLHWKSEHLVAARLGFIAHNASSVNDTTDEPQRATWESVVAPQEPIEEQLVTDNA